MNNKTSFLIVFLLMVAAFLAGSTAAKVKYGKEGKEGGEGAKVIEPTPVPFNPKKSAKPEVKFFVMSFCPFGNQAEAGLEPVYQLLKDKVSWQPRYIVSDKKASCEQSCPLRVYNDAAKSRCEQAIKDGQVEDMETCKGYFPYQNGDECLKKECAGLKAGEYESLHGAQELNQDVREIVAFNLGDLSNWWKFVSLINSKCNSNDADTCWLAQAKEAGLDVDKILAEAKTKTKTILEQEIAEAKKYDASGSPTIYINDTIYNGGRSSEDYKKAICSAFENPPPECNKILGQESSASGGRN